MADRREDALRYAMTFLHQPYRWGGFSPIGMDAGFDCSGFVVEDHKMVGLLPRGRYKDWTAGGLLTLYRGRGKETFVDPVMVKPGDLLFWRNTAGGIRHVEICIEKYGTRHVEEEIMTIGASGGGSKTISLAVAREQDARIKIRRAYDGWEALDPF